MSIESTITHTKFQETPNEVLVLPIFSNKVVDRFWSGRKQTVWIQAASDGVPVFYHTESLPTHSNDDFSGDVSVTVDYHTPPIGSNVAAPIGDYCLNVLTGGIIADITVDVSDADGETIVGECGCETDIPNKNVFIGELTFNLAENFDNHDGISTTQTVEFRSLEEPYHLNVEKWGDSLLNKLEMFDVVDLNGNGIIFGGDNNSSISKMLKIIFGDIFTGRVLERIVNFGENLWDINQSDVGSLDDMSQMMGDVTENYTTHMPVEILEILRICSMKYEHIFPQSTQVPFLDDSNLDSTIMEGGEIINSGETVYVRNKNVIGDPYPLKVPELTGDVVDMNDVATRQESYTVENFDAYGVNFTDYDFWKASYEDEYKKGILDVSHIMSKETIPTKEEWDEIIELKIEYILMLECFRV